MREAPETGSLTVMRKDIRNSGVRIAITIAIDASSDHNFWADLAMTMDRGGVFVATYRTLELGTLVDLRITLPDGVETICVEGVVRWMRPHLDGSDGAAGIGIKFVDLSATARDRIERFARVREPMVFELEETPMRRRRAAS